VTVQWLQVGHGSALQETAAPHRYDAEFDRSFQLSGRDRSLHAPEESTALSANVAVLR
jgi:hypothetical protein